MFPDYHAEAPGGTQGGRSMVTRPFDGAELGSHQGYRRPLPELTVFGMMLGSGKEIVHFMRATNSLTRPSMSPSAVEALARCAAAWPRHDADQRQRVGRPACQIGFRSRLPAWLSTPGRTVHRGWRGARRDRRAGGKPFAQRPGGVVLACGGFPMTSRSKALFPHAPTGREHYTPGPAETPAMACAWAKRSAAKSTRPCRTLRPGFRYRPPPVRTAARASCRTSSIAPSRA